MASSTRTTGLRPAREPPGTLILGRYRLHKPLGAGGFGTVWLARDERLEREVAVKVLPRERVIGGRFEREARATARLSHPAIVTLYEAAVDDDAAYLVSELVRGSTFAELIEAGRLSDRDIVTIGIALCDALEHAHGHGVVHRDVKPSNVLVPEQPSSPAETAKLTDFGVARLIGGNTLTRTGDVIGTAGYMAPEQAEGREVDAAADLYSLALVLYQALTGINPIAAGTAAARARRLGAHLPSLRRHRRDLPRELGRTIDLALRPRPRERGTVAGLRAGLVETLNEVEDMPGTVEPPWPRQARDTVGPLPPAGDDAGAIGESQPPQPRIRWPSRALGAAGAALIAGWLTSTAFASPPLAPAAAALLAGLAVAALPRIGWMALSLTAAGALTAQGRAGGALVVLISLFVPVMLLPRTSSRWPLVAAAPALGALLLAGAWPALAGRGATAYRRAALGAAGWIWVALAGVIAGRGVYAQLPPGLPRPALWMQSPSQTVRHTLWPLLHSGLLAPALVWGVAAALLPWIVRGPASIRLVLIIVWSAGLAGATTTMLRILHAGTSTRPGAVALGAVAGGIVALAPAFLKTRQKASPSSDTAAGLA